MSSQWANKVAADLKAMREARDDAEASRSAAARDAVGRVSLWGTGKIPSLPKSGRLAMRASASGFDPYPRAALGVRSKPFALPRRENYELPLRGTTSRPQTEGRWLSSFQPDEMLPILADNILPSAYRRPPTRAILEGLEHHPSQPPVERSLHRPFKVVLDPSERRANHRLAIDIGARGTTFEITPSPTTQKPTLTGQSGWLDARLEMTPRPVRGAPKGFAPRMAATRTPYGGGVRRSLRSRGGGPAAFYVPSQQAAGFLTPMREHASASGFSSEPFVGLR